MLLTLSIAIEVAVAVIAVLAALKGRPQPLRPRLHLCGLCPLWPRPFARLACRGRHPVCALPLGERERALCCMGPVQGKALIAAGAAAVT